MNLQFNTPETETITNKPRLFFIDNLRLLMIILVVLIHINVTYSGIGGWYYVEQNHNTIDTVTKILCAVFGMFTQAYFMGFLFFLAGYFVPSAYDRKGAARFIADRFIRLGLPVLVYAFIINPFIIHFLLNRYNNRTFQSLSAFYSNYLTSLDFLGGTGPLWFALALLFFSIFYALIRLAGVKPVSSESNWPLTKNITVASIIIIVSVLAFAVRLIFPIGTDIFNMQLCFFVQYIILFAAGILSYRRKIFTALSYKFGIGWFKFGVIFGFIFWVFIIVAGGALDGNENALMGGLYWQSAAYALWESIFCAGVCLGLLVIFREKLNKSGKLLSFLSDNSFGVYVFHAPILIFISITLKNIALYPLLKALLVAVITLPTCFAFSYIIRKIPVMKKLFS